MGISRVNTRRRMKRCVDEHGASVARLEVEIKMGKDLPKMDWYSGKCDGYVTLSLSPPAACPDTSDRRTRVTPRERSPQWNQAFVFTPIEFKKADLILNVMDAENFGNDDFMGKIIIPLTSIDHQEWEEAWYPLTDPEKKSEAKALSGSILIRTKFIHSEKLKLEQELKAHAGDLDKLHKDMKKIVNHINRLEGKEGAKRGGDDDEAWLYAEFDDDVPLLFTDIEPVHETMISSGEDPETSKYDMCSIM
jgi:hypothetical protein